MKSFIHSLLYPFLWPTSVGTVGCFLAVVSARTHGAYFSADEKQISRLIIRQTVITSVTTLSPQPQFHAITLGTDRSYLHVV